MTESYEPKAIIRLPNGTYTWNCATSLEYVRGQLWTGFKVCAAIDVVILAVGVVLYITMHALELLMIFAAIAAGFLALIVLIFGLSFLIYRNPRERYQLRDTFVMTGSGRSASWFDYHRTKVLTIRRDYLELRGRFAVMRVYVPEEDFAFVRDYIKYRMPDEAEIVYL